MPGLTPIYGISYPIMGEPITAATFEQFATEVQAVFDELALLESLMTRPNTAMLFGSASGLAIASGTTFTPTLTANPAADPNSMFNGTDGFVIPISCALMLQGRARVTGPGATGMWVGFSLNGVDQLPAHLKSGGAVANAPQTTITTMLPVTAGDVVRLRVQWNGSGNATAWSVSFFVSIVAPLV
jgi:hypothetical protein